MAMDLTLRLPVDLGPLGEQIGSIDGRLECIGEQLGEIERLLRRQKHEILTAIREETTELDTALAELAAKAQGPDLAPLVAKLKAHAARLGGMTKPPASESVKDAGADTVSP